MQRTHLGAALLGSRNVVDVEAVLRPHVTADVAVAEMDARPLALPVSIRELPGVLRVERVLELVVPVLGEADGQAGLRETIRVAQVARRLAGEHEALGQLAIGNDLKVHLPGDRVVVGLQLGVGDLRGPAFGEDLRTGLHRDAAVGQRSAADAGGLRHGHASEEAHVHPAVEQGRMVVTEDPGVAGSSRVLIDLPPPAALEHEHAHALLREPARRDRPAKAAADHDDVERCGHADGRCQRRTRVSLTRTCVDGSLRSSRQPGW